MNTTIATDEDIMREASAMAHQPSIIYTADPEASAFQSGASRGVNALAEAIRLHAVEPLADYAHSAWSNWMTYLFSKSTQNEDGSVTIPRELVERWTRQATTLYPGLPEGEKESDRKEAYVIIETIVGTGSL